jgi:transposase
MKGEIEQELRGENFLKRLKKEAQAETRMRLLGMEHLKEGKSTKEVGEILKISRISIRKWYNRYKKEGIEGLRNKAGKGRKSLMPKDKEEEIRKEIEALQAERAGGRIRGQDVQQRLKEKVGINYSMGSIYHVLKKHKMSGITARSIHPTTNQEEQESFKKNSKKI